MGKPVRAVREYTSEQVNKAGRRMTALTLQALHGKKPGDWPNEDVRDFRWSQEVISNWRACHAYPLNVFQTNLRRSARLRESRPPQALRRAITNC
jgi:hypothetical protein